MGYYDTLLKHFDDCLTAHYRHVEEDASFAVKRENNTVTIYFEKSNGVEDWKNNFRFAARPYRDMKEPWRCHGGFMKVFRALLQYLEEILLNEEVTHYILVGYSHGAALALLCHEYLLYHRPELLGKVEGYGFGCPRVIAGHIPASLRARLYGFRVIKNVDDIVTHLPPKLFGYSHVTKPETIGTRGRYSMVEAHFDESYRRELKSLSVKEKEGALCDGRGNGSGACP